MAPCWNCQGTRWAHGHRCPVCSPKMTREARRVAQMMNGAGARNPAGDAVRRELERMGRER